MVTRIGGMRRKTRNKLSKHARKKGKISIRNSLQQFSQGDKVLLAAEPAVQDGMYFPRFHGKIGTVLGEQGHCYKVQIMDGNSKKVVIAHPVHLRATQ
jgi:large subunit ribosomal protein L21e